MDIKSIPDYSTTAAVSSVRPTSVQQDAATASISISDGSSSTLMSNVVTANANSASLNNQMTDQGNPDSVQNKTALSQNKKELTKKDVEQITDGLNDFMESMNTDIRFVLHNKLQELMVQVVDNKTHKVLREAPPKELLDTIARIREFVGSLLDKKI